MPVAPPFPATAPAHNALFPALYLYPLNDTWAPKHIALTSTHTKIGRQTSSKTAPGERNGFFDSKVLSRQHAEVWEEGGKIFIKDVKSSNGTFINGERLSSEGHESEPFELKSDDIVEFGIDIVGEDNKTIIHHKVAARVVCVFSEQDAAVAARAEQHQAAAAAQHAQQQQQHLNLNPHQQQQHLHHQQQQQLHQSGLVGIPPAGVHHGYLNGPNGLGIGAAGGPGSAGPSTAPQRRALGHAGLGGMGGPPSLTRAPGKSGSGLTFDVILSRLQGEVQKSRETGAELGGLAGLMGDVENVLGGRGPPNLQSFPAHLPPVRPPAEAAPQPPPSGPVPPPPGAPLATSSPPPNEQSAPAASSPTSEGAPAAESSKAALIAAAPADISSQATVSVLQVQLAETQASLSAHLERVRALEGVLKEQESIKREVGMLRGLVEGRRPDGGAAVADNHDDDESSSILLHGEAERHQGKSNGTSYEPEELTLLERDPRDEHETLANIGLEDVLEEDEDEEADDDEDDSRSIGTIMAHELERVDEVDEEALAEEEHAAAAAQRAQEQEHDEDHFRPSIPTTNGDMEDHEQSAFDHDDDDRYGERDHRAGDDDLEETQQEIEEQERRRAEDLGMGRPRTPEPSLLLIRERERRSPLAAISNSNKDIKGERGAPSPTPSKVQTSAYPPISRSISGVTTEDVHAQVERLSAQVGAVLALTSTLEKQHANAQDTIRELELKVKNLEGLLEKGKQETGEAVSQSSVASSEVTVDAEPNGIAEEKVDIVTDIPSPDASDEETVSTNEDQPMSLTAWARTLAGQWTSVQAEWTRERVALSKAREEWEARTYRLDSGLVALDTGLSRLDNGLVRLDSGLSKIEGALVRVDSGLGKVDGVQSAVANLLVAQERVREAVREQEGRLDAHITSFQTHVTASEAARAASAAHWGSANGDAIKRVNGGLVTPPSPRSQSSDSSRYRRRRRRSSGSRRGADGLKDGSGESEGEDGEEDGEEGSHGIARALGVVAATASGVGLATPASSVYGMQNTEARIDDPPVKDINGEAIEQSSSSKTVNGVLTAPATRANSSSISEVESVEGSLEAILANAEKALEARTEERLKAAADAKRESAGQTAINVQAAIGVLLLSVAAAAVFWKVKPE